MSDFDWGTNKSVVIPTVMGVAVYPNDDGDIVIRQQDALGGDDQFIVIPVDRAKSLIESLMQALDQ